MKKTFAVFYGKCVEAPLGTLLAEGINAAEQVSFNVVIAYEDSSTGDRAKRTYDQLLHAFGKDRVFHDAMWRFDALRVPYLREAAAAEAAWADLIIIATWSHGDLPEEVKLWVEQWLEQRSSHLGALAVLLEDSAEGNRNAAASIYSYLQEVARRGHMDFYTQVIHPSRAKHRLGGGSPATVIGQADLAEDEIWEEVASYPRWGINE